VRAIVCFARPGTEYEKATCRCHHKARRREKPRSLPDKKNKVVQIQIKSRASLEEATRECRGEVWIRREDESKPK